MARAPIATPDRVAAITQATRDIGILASLVRCVGIANVTTAETTDWLATELERRRDLIEDSLS